MKKKGISLFVKLNLKLFLKNVRNEKEQSSVFELSASKTVIIKPPCNIIKLNGLMA